MWAQEHVPRSGSLRGSRTAPALGGTARADDSTQQSGSALLPSGLATSCPTPCGHVGMRGVGWGLLQLSRIWGGARMPGRPGSKGTRLEQGWHGVEVIESYNH